MASARDCARLLLETMPSLKRGLGGPPRSPRGPDQESLTMEQVRLLRMLSHGPHSLGELAARQGVTPSTMSRSVDVLVRRGWVSRESDLADRRQVILQLAAAGRAAHAEMVQQQEDNATRLLEALSDAERARLCDGLQILQALLTRRGAGQEVEAVDRGAGR